MENNKKALAEELKKVKEFYTQTEIEMSEATLEQEKDSINRQLYAMDKYIEELNYRLGL